VQRRIAFQIPTAGMNPINSIARAPTLSTHLLQDPQVSRYIEVDHLPSQFPKARASRAREAIVANRLSQFFSKQHEAM
jgi:hypothetical protein